MSRKIYSLPEILLFLKMQAKIYKFFGLFHVGDKQIKAKEPPGKIFYPKKISAPLKLLCYDQFKYVIFLQENVS